MAKSKIIVDGEGEIQYQIDCDILDKDQGRRTYVAYMLDRTNQMFEYSGLPDTIPAYQLEFLLQINGSLAFVKIGGELYALVGGAGGARDPYYRPTRYIVANPALAQETYNFRIANHLPPYDVDSWSKMEPCVYMKNDTRAKGLLPLFSRYATQMVENDVSIRSAQINSRQQTLIAAATGAEQEGAKVYVEDLTAGKIAVVGTRPFLDGIKVENVSTRSSNSIIQLIELQQYLKASWYNELGLNSSFNMKREYVSAEEIAASNDMLLPLVDDMLFNRRIAIESINKLFGTKISVTKNSAWENKAIEINKDLDEGGEEDAKVDEQQTDTEERNS